VADVMVMQIGNSRKDLPHDNCSLSLINKLLLDDEVEEFSTITYLRNQIDCLLRLVDLIEFDDVGVIELLEELYFSGKHFLIHNIFFGNCLDCSALS
jgi:hypothetical protein